MRVGVRRKEKEKERKTKKKKKTKKKRRKPTPPRSPPTLKCDVERSCPINTYNNPCFVATL